MNHESFRVVELARISRDGVVRTTDAAACEEPLEVRLHGEPFAVIMRTPGDDHALAAGFLFAERVILSGDDLGTLEHCGRADDGRQNVVNVTLTPGRAAAAAAATQSRRTVTSSSCGLCGRATIESLLVQAPPLTSDWRLAADVLVQLPAALRAVQATFDRTGGLHAAGLFTPAGTLDAMAEDVGRHNAVDKVVGRALMADRVPLHDRALFVSGRTSYEIVQKAFLAGIPIVAAVSAPSSLAITLAQEAGITLAGFVRDGACNIYTHAERISSQN